MRPPERKLAATDRTELSILFWLRLLLMDAQVTQVIVTTSESSSAAVVHHRDFPEIRAEGGSPKEAAAHLVNKLACALDSALTDWRRKRVDQAIADVKAYVEQDA
jgi:hypothetical protein